MSWGTRQWLKKWWTDGFTTDVLLMESNEADKQPKEVYEQLLATFSKEGQWRIQREGPDPLSPLPPPPHQQ